jgi:hypothetical protein
VNVQWSTKDDPDAIGGKLYCVIANDDCGVLATYNRDDEEFVEFDPLDGISSWLDPRYVFVFMSVGNEKFRYVEGHATAVNSQGEIEVVRLDDIYARAAEKFGQHLKIMEAMY